jgi:hypothetical protein
MLLAAADDWAPAEAWARLLRRVADMTFSDTPAFFRAIKASVQPGRCRPDGADENKGAEENGHGEGTSPDNA